MRACIPHLLALGPFAIITAAYLALMVAHEYRTSAGLGQYRFDLHAAEHLWDYLRLLAFPAPDGWWAWTEQLRTALAAVTLCAGAVALVCRRGMPAVLLGWVLVVSLPYSFFPDGIEYRYTYLAAAPFTLFWVALATAGLRRLAGGRLHLPVAAAAALGVVLLCLWLGAATRERQSWLHEQALAYDQLVREAPSVCGHLPAGSTIYVLNDPVFDLYDESTRAALRLRYQMVDVRRMKDGSMPAFGGDAASTCVIAFANGRYALPPAEPVPAPTFTVNRRPMACRAAPEPSAPRIAPIPTGSVQAMDQRVLRRDGLWHRDVDRHCWVRTDGASVHLFAAATEAQNAAAAMRR